MTAVLDAAPLNLADAARSELTGYAALVEALSAFAAGTAELPSELATSDRLGFRTSTRCRQAVADWLERHADFHASMLDTSRTGDPATVRCRASISRSTWNLLRVRLATLAERVV